MTGALALMGGLVGCNVSSPPSSTGGTNLGGSGSCPSGMVVVASDYQSTNIAVSKADGTTASGSFVSSGATKPGLALALSGDVVVPFAAPAPGTLVLLDRYGANVLTWMKVSDASVIAQLPVGTGFESNPHDYLEVDATRAYVSRYGTNPTPGAMPFDQGSDLLIVDRTNPAAPAISGRIAIPEDDPGLQPCPDGMNWLGHEVVLTLGRWAADFSRLGDGRFVGIDPTGDHLDWTVNVTGLQNCGRLAVSPSGKLAAIACSSAENQTTMMFDTSKSDIVVYDATKSPPVELRRLGLAQKLGAGIQTTLAFGDEDTLFASAYGGNAIAGDSVFAVSATTGEVTSLATASAPFTLGGLLCTPGCGNVCVITDADKNVLRRWQVGSDGKFTALADVDVDPTVGLPPRDVGALR
jgi:hypothetical protein